ncbi:hypothetical protein PR048_014011, partial [Dryococelus australis]
MTPLRKYFEQEVRKLLAAHPGRHVTIYQVAKPCGNAFTKAAVMGTAISGFKNTGLLPFNRDAIPDHLFAPAEMTERPLTTLVQPQDISLQSEVGLPFPADSREVLPTFEPLDADVDNNVHDAEPSHQHQTLTMPYHLHQRMTQSVLHLHLRFRRRWICPLQKKETGAKTVSTANLLLAKTGFSSPCASNGTMKNVVAMKKKTISFVIFALSKPD